MTIKHNIVNQLLDHISITVEQIESMEFSIDTLLEDVDVQHLLERRLHLAVEAAIDVASHIAAALNLPNRETARDVFQVLGREEVITPELSASMQQAAGLRNILIHEYGEIDHRHLFHSYKEDLNDLHEFIRQIIDFLEKAR